MELWGGNWGALKLTEVIHSLGIELTKIMVLQYSNQETSVTIGESVRDEDGTLALFPANPWLFCKGIAEK